MRYICLLFLLASCGTTKTVYKETVRTDSTAIHELELARRTIETQREYYETLLSDSTGVKIEYQNGNGGVEYFPIITPHLDSSTHGLIWTDPNSRAILTPWNGNAATPMTMPMNGIIGRDFEAPARNAVTISSDGSISAEGRLKSVSVTNSKLMKDISQRDRVIDSFSHLQRRDSIIYRTTTITKTKHVHHRSLWWLWLAIGLVAGWAARHNWPRLRTWAATIKGLR
jgi:hypothetical protein